MYELIIKASAEKQMDCLPAKVRERIVKALAGLRDDPRPPSCLKLTGEDDLWRIRVGDYRIVYTIADEALIVLVVRVAHRKDVY
ncbi:MAG: type II toxin-antitoxin system RelE/ParE family toxin [Gemmataceae bacterium]|nr:type II toxin-antitoxin system RelE/ParE family toxin [Gemmataceae bacterium]